MEPPRSPDDMPLEDLEERVKLAKERTDKVVKEVWHALLAQKVNATVIYSEPFAKSIPPGAWRAYRQLRRNLHAFEIIRLCVLWDPADDDKVSIPTIVRLVEDKDVRACLVQEARERWGRTLAEIERFDDAVVEAKKTEGSSELRALKNARHKYLAHSLVSTKRERKGHVDEKLKYGDERRFLDKTVEVVRGLQLVIQEGGGNFEWEAEWRKAERDARAFWDRVTFSHQD